MKPLDPSTLRAIIASKSDGPWELLATSVGVRESVSRTARGLSAGAIRATSVGDAISPAVIDCRVQAVAAYDPALLEKIAADWAPIATLCHRGLEEIEVDFWTAAWVSSLRFLPSVGRAMAFMPEGLPLPLSREIGVLYGAAPAVPLGEAVTRAGAGSLTYDEMRIMARSIRDNEEASLDHLRVLLAETGPRADERLRILAEPTQRISTAAMAYLEELFEAYWIAADDGSEHGAGLVLMELVIRNGLRKELHSRAAEKLVARLEHDGPRAWACSAYLLAGTRWTCP